MRVLIAVTHLLGAGHLIRAEAIGRALARRGHEVTLASGGRPAPLIPHAGSELVQLPPVAGRADDLATLRDETGAPASNERLRARRTLLLDTLRRTHPDAVVTEHFPFGRRSLAAEFLALIEAARSLPARPVLVASVRDVLVRPEKEDKVRRAHDVLASRYDAVLVHGDPTVLPLDLSWPVDERLRPFLRYTGYVDGEPTGGRAALADARSEIIVSGGSSAAGLPLYRAAIGAALKLPHLPWRVLVGAGVEPDAFTHLAASAGSNVVVERARPDFRRLLAGSALFVGQAGYNTVVDLFATGARALLVPFEQGQETEQRLRAEALAARGLADVLPEAELTAARLAQAVLMALARSRPASATVEAAGAENSVQFLEELVGSKRRESRVA